MFYTVYKVTNKANGKFYIGAHKTKNLDDDYMGSGKLLKLAISKYGLQNFEKEILHVFDNPEDMFAKEAEIVTDEFLQEHNTYNLKVGGFGGFNYINENPDKYLTDKRLAALNKGGVFRTTEKKRRASAATLIRLHKQGKLVGFAGKKHSDETKRLMSEKAKQRTGERNGATGSVWIHNLSLNESRRVKQSDLDQYLEEGWLKGRKMKF